MFILDLEIKTLGGKESYSTFFCLGFLDLNEVQKYLWNMFE